LFIFLSGEYAGGATTVTGAAEKNDSEIGSDLKRNGLQSQTCDDFEQRER
jgi:hypothetical protein